jgi:hypothetical protein
VTGHEGAFEVAPDNRTDESELAATEERVEGAAQFNPSARVVEDADQPVLKRFRIAVSECVEQSYVGTRCGLSGGCWRGRSRPQRL